MNILKKDYPKLYTLDKTGMIRAYESCIEYDSINDVYVIITMSGRLNGVMIKHSKNVKIGKNLNKANYTTPEEQAINEGQSKWNSKLDEGYKSEAMYMKKLGITYTLESINAYFVGLNILFNTNKDWHELPMLAQPIKKIKKLPYAIYVQPKFNGVRCIAKYYNSKILLLSRGGKYYKLPHISDQLERIFKNNPSLILDGEIYGHGHSLQTISGTVRRDNTDIFTDISWLNYCIYDIISREPQSVRYQGLQTLKNKYDHLSPNLEFAETTLTTSSEKNIKSYHDVYVNAGYEGLIVRSTIGKYEIGFRSRHLIKVKEFIDEEFEVLGGNVDTAKTIEDSFTFVLKNNTDEQVFKARPRGTREDKKRWWEDMQSIIGKQATVRYQERTDGGLPHQGHVVVIRDYE